MKNRKKIIEKITSAIEKQIAYASSYKLHYYSIRRWRVDMDEKYIDPIFRYYQGELVKKSNLVSTIEDKEKVTQKSAELLDDYQALTSVKRRYLKIYQKDSSILFYKKVVKLLFMTKTYRLKKVKAINEIYKKSWRMLKKRKIYELFMDRSLIKTSPNMAIKAYYRLKYLRLSKNEKRFLLRLKRVLTKRTKKTAKFKRNISALAQIIISASYELQISLERADYEWVFSYFEKHSEKIFKNTNPYIVAKVALCFCLIGEGDKKFVQKAKEHIIAHFDKKSGLVKRTDKHESFSFLLKSNIYTILLLSEVEEYNLGPNLSAYMAVKKKKLYVPEKTIRVAKEEFS